MQDLLIHNADGVMTLTLNRPEKKNSFTQAMYGAAADALLQATDDPGVHVVVIQGHETIFSAGNDISDFLNRDISDPNPPVARFLRGMTVFPKPLIASVCGPAVGIGTTLLFHCDLVYAGDNAAFSMPFVNLGLCAEAGSSLLAPRMMGYHRAAEALLMGDPFMAEAALEVGLVNRIVPPSEANHLAQSQARKLAAKPLPALMATKRLMKQGQTDEVLAQINEESKSFGQLMQSPHAKEAFTAFLEKRKPDFAKL